MRIPKMRSCYSYIKGYIISIVHHASSNVCIADIQVIWTA